MSPRHADPDGTPLPRPASSPSLDGLPPIHECLYPELIDDVRQSRKRRWPVVALVVTLLGGSLGALSTCVYSQGQASGATAVRVEALETRTHEDRETVDLISQRQREDAQAAALRHTELLEALHAIDSRLGRLEERQTPRR